MIFGVFSIDFACMPKKAPSPELNLFTKLSKDIKR